MQHYITLPEEDRFPVLEESPVRFPGEGLNPSNDEPSPTESSRSTPSARFRGHLSEALINDLFEQVALERSHEAFDELYDLLYPKAFAQVFRVLKSEEDARDLTQEVFAQVWEKAPTIYPHRNTAGWIIEMAKRRAIDETRSSRFRHTEMFDSDQHEHLLPHAEIFDDELAPEKLQRRIALAMEALTPGQRRVMELIFAGKSYREISAVLQATEGAVRKTVFDAYRRIRPRVLSDKRTSRNALSNNGASNGTENRVSGASTNSDPNEPPAEAKPKKIKPARKSTSEEIASVNGSLEPTKENGPRKKDRTAIFAELQEMEPAQTPLDQKKDALLQELEAQVHSPLSHSS